MHLARLSPALLAAAWCFASQVHIARVPDGGIQPDAKLDRNDTVHLVYFAGDPKNGDIFYARSVDWGRTWSKSLRVNSQPGSAVALGAMRGPKIAVGREGRIHVTWNGSSVAQPRGPLNPEMPDDSPYNGLPMLYARLNIDGSSFEPQRNLMRKTFGLDGGGSVAADGQGNVYVAWHAKAPGAAEGEAGRRVWLAHSADDGATFAAERPISDPRSGSCACCGLALLARREGALFGLFRIAQDMVHRDVHLLSSANGTGPFRESPVDEWEIGACPASAMALSGAEDGIVGAWETRGQVLYADFAATGPTAKAVPAPGEGKRRKYPAVARNGVGETILAWTQDGAWGRGGALFWQVSAASGEPSGDPGRVDKIAAWNFAAVFARTDGDFVVLY